jgi:hypothetical protein
MAPGSAECSERSPKCAERSASLYLALAPAKPRLHVLVPVKPRLHAPVPVKPRLYALVPVKPRLCAPGPGRLRLALSKLSSLPSLLWQSWYLDRY